MPLSPYSSCQIPGKLQTLQISGELIFLRMYGLYTLDFFGCFLSLIASFRRMQKLERRSPAGSSLKLLFPFFVSFMKTLWALMQILSHLQRWAKLISSNLHEFSNLNKTEKERTCATWHRLCFSSFLSHIFKNMLAWILSSPSERQRGVRGIENRKRSTRFAIENSLLERPLLVCYF